MNNLKNNVWFFRAQPCAVLKTPRYARRKEDGVFTSCFGCRQSNLQARRGGSGKSRFQGAGIRHRECKRGQTVVGAVSGRGNVPTPSFQWGGRVSRGWYSHMPYTAPLCIRSLPFVTWSCPPAHTTSVQYLTNGPRQIEDSGSKGVSTLIELRREKIFIS